MHSAYRIPAVLRYNAIERGRSVSVHKDSFTPGFALHMLLRARGAKGKFRIEFYVPKHPYLRLKIIIQSYLSNFLSIHTEIRLTLVWPHTDQSPVQDQVNLIIIRPHSRSLHA